MSKIPGLNRGRESENFRETRGSFHAIYKHDRFLPIVAMMSSKPVETVPVKIEAEFLVTTLAMGTGGLGKRPGVELKFQNTIRLVINSPYPEDRRLFSHDLNEAEADALVKTLTRFVHLSNVYRSE